MKYMLRRFLILIIITITALLAHAQTIPQASPLASIMQRVGVTDITIEYSRPSVKGRQVWGGLVPYGYGSFSVNGKAPWRGGANKMTHMDVPHDIAIGGTEVKAGKYGLSFAIYENGSVDLLLLNTPDYWGTFYFKEETDVVYKIKTCLEDSPVFHEMLTYHFEVVTTKEARAYLSWEKKRIPILISVNTDDIAFQQLQAEQLTAHAVTNFPAWHIAASTYLLLSETHPEQGEQWMSQVVNPQMGNYRIFQTLTTLANFQLLQGKREEAMKTIAEAYEVSPPNAGILNYYGGQMLGLGKGYPDIAIQAYQELLDKHAGNEFPAYQGLAKAYSMKGNLPTAKEMLEKAKSHLPDGQDSSKIDQLIRKLKAGNPIHDPASK